MILSVLQLVSITVVVALLCRWRAGVRRRNTQSWASLLARLRTDWSARGLSGTFLSKEGLSATPEETWTHMHGVQGLWAMYQNARVMIEIADYAAQNSDSVDHLLLESLRGDAVQIRMCVLKAVAQHAICKTCDGARVNAYRAASMYTGMAARTTQLLQANAAVIVPDFVAAM
jgi:hypothetical protein